MAQRTIEQAWAAGDQVAWCADRPALAEINARAVAEAARQGDGLAQQIFATAGTYLGYGLALLIDILNPEVIVLGSLYVRCADLLDGPMRAALGQEALPLALGRCQVVPAALSERIGDYAALAVAYSPAKAAG
jgi:glucokinase